MFGEDEGEGSGVEILIVAKLPGRSNVMLDGKPVNAALKLPGPESFVFVTVIVGNCAWATNMTRERTKDKNNFLITPELGKDVIYIRKMGKK